jgi:hypothetical protein
VYRLHHLLRVAPRQLDAEGGVSGPKGAASIQHFTKPRASLDVELAETQVVYELAVSQAALFRAHVGVNGE